MRTSILLLLLLLCAGSFAQIRNAEESARNAVFIELAGIGGYGSLNYERTLYQYNRWKLNGRAAVSTYRLRDFNNSFNPDLIFPFSAALLYGNKHHLELGAGRIITSITHFNEQSGSSERELHMNSTVYAGYRYQKTGGGLLFRVTYSPLFTDDVRWNWGGVSIGYSF